MNINWLKYIGFLLTFFLISQQLKSGNEIGKWKTYLAYQNSEIVVETANLVFAVYDGSLISYNPEDEEVRTYSFEDGLNDVRIRLMEYSPEVGALILVYENGNIDLYFGQNDIYNLPFIKNDIYLQNKAVNDLRLINGNAYISTGFGVVVLDLKRKEVKETYRLGVEVRSTEIYGDYIYAYTTAGVKRALLSSNLLDKENWDLMQINYPGNFANSRKILFFQDQMVLVEINQVYTVDIHNDNVVKNLWNGWVRYATIDKDRFILCVYSAIQVYSKLTAYVYTPISLSVEYFIPSKKANSYWVANTEGGIMRITAENGSKDFEVDIPEIIVNSPKRNNNFYMTYNNNKLYVVGGGKKRDSTRENLSGTLMIMENNQWVNIDETAITEKTGLVCKDLISVAIDPCDPDHYFVASYGEGVYEFQNNEFVKLHSENNSTLESALPNNEKSNEYVRVDGLVYDRNNNLWVSNSAATNALHVLSSDGKWERFYYDGIANKDLNQILITRNNQKWMNIWRGSNVGLCVIDNDGNQYFSSTFDDQRGKAIGATSFTCMAEDKSGTIWVGTDIGPITFSSPQQVGNGVCSRSIPEDEYELGYYLLENQKVTAIAVDGGNRKWIGTDGGGLFVVYQDNEGKMFAINYTQENSYLLSDQINSIAINDKTGEIFIGTSNGLCSYMSEATEGKSDYSDVYAFPNPVYLSRTNQVVITGLMSDSNVKITDLAGNMIQEGKSMGGQYLWNCTDRFGSLVKAGIYLVFAATPSGSEGVVTKIVVIK